MEIKLGTSGYSFADWVGTFYPDHIEKGKMLDYYVNHFDTVEINSTYYRVPHPAVMAKIEQKTPAHFEFMIKVPQALTHVRKDIAGTADEFLNCLKPLEDSGKLKGLLAQFPFSFKFSQQNLDYIKSCRERLAPHGLFVEFRHDSWVNRTMYDAFKSHDIGYVSVDEPQIQGLLKPDCFNTTGTGYIRLHGRNAEKWWDGGALRYDYDYSSEQLQGWKQKIEKLEGKANKVYIFFNNCHAGQAIKNAREMKQILMI